MADSKISDLLQSRERAGRFIILALLIGGLGAAGLYGWGQIVPWLVDVAYDTVKLGLLCGALVAMGFVVMNERLRTLAIYVASSGVRWLTSQFTEIDPIGILKTYVSRLKGRLKEMMTLIGELRGQRDQLQQRIDANEAERVKSLQRAKHAQEIVARGGDQAAQFRGEVMLSGRQAGRLGKSNETLGSLLARMNKLLTGSEKMYEVSNILMQDIEAEVKVREDEYKAISKGFSVMKRAQSLMIAGGPEKELYDETLNKLADDYNSKMGQIEYFMEVSKSVINGVDLDNMAYEEDALAQLAKWEDEAHAEGAAPNATRVSGARPRIASSPGVRVEATEEEASPDSFGSLFEGDRRKGGRS